MQSRGRLFLQNMPCMRVQCSAANVSAVRRAMSYDVTPENEGRPRHSNESRQSRYSNNGRGFGDDYNNTRDTRFSNESRDSQFSNNLHDYRYSNYSQRSRHSRPQRGGDGHRGGRRHSEIWARLLRETSGRDCTLSYSEKQARWNELRPETREPTRDVFVRNLPPFVTIDSIQSAFPAVGDTHYRNRGDGSIMIRFNSVEEAEKAVNAINNGVEFPFAIPQDPKLKSSVDLRPPIRATYLATRVTDPQTTTMYITYYQGTERALAEKLKPYVPVGHTLQFRYDEKGQVLVDMGSIEAVKAACEGLQGASHTCEIPLLAAASLAPREWNKQDNEREGMNYENSDQHEFNIAFEAARIRRLSPAGNHDS